MAQFVVKIFTASRSFELLAFDSGKASVLLYQNASKLLQSVCDQVVAALDTKPLDRNELRSIQMSLSLPEETALDLQELTARVSCWQNDTISVIGKVEVAFLKPAALQRETAKLTTIEAVRQLLHETAQPVQALHAFSGLLEEKLRTEQTVVDDKVKRWSHSIHEQTTRLAQSIVENRSLYSQPKDPSNGIPKQNLHAVLSLLIESLHYLIEGYDLMIKCIPCPQRQEANCQEFTVTFITQFVFFYLELLISNAQNLLTRKIEILISNAVHFPLPLLPSQIAQLEHQHFDPKSIDLGLSLQILKRLSLTNIGRELTITSDSSPEMLLGA